MIIFFAFLLIFSIFTQIYSAPQILAASNETEISFHQDTNILISQKHIFKKQLFSSVQILDLGKLALLKKNILTQIRPPELATHVLELEEKGAIPNQQHWTQYLSKASQNAMWSQAFNVII